jgi:hypothetical protein
MPEDTSRLTCSNPERKGRRIVEIRKEKVVRIRAEKKVEVRGYVAVTIFKPARKARRTLQCSETCDINARGVRVR